MEGERERVVDCWRGGVDSCIYQARWPSGPGCKPPDPFRPVQPPLLWLDARAPAWPPCARLSSCITRDVPRHATPGTRPPLLARILWLAVRSLIQPHLSSEPARSRGWAAGWLAGTPTSCSN
jgi:hypothetical protein